MRLIGATLLLCFLTACASVRNAPVQPGKNYWPINEKLHQQQEDGANVR